MAVRYTVLAVVCAAAVLARPLVASNADVTLESGVYENLVIGVKRGTAQPEDGSAFLDAVKDFLDEASAALNIATDGKASFGDVTLLVPRDWNASLLGSVQDPLPGITLENADILLHDDPDTIPDTLQVEQCGVPGRQIRIPTPFLTLSADDELVYGTKGRILTHEWAHYRWGAHDEHGFSADPLYGAGYGEDEATPTSCTAGELQGEWRSDCDEVVTCRPNREGCFFCIDTNATAADTRASLGYLPALSEGKFCDASTHNRDGPSPQNMLCGRRSVMELIEAHPDTANMAPVTPAPVTVILRHEPIGRVLLLLDTPEPGQSGVLDSDYLLDELKESLTSYTNMQLALMVYTDDGLGGAQLDVKRSFSVVSAEDYDVLKDYLPDEASRDNTPKLSDVLTKVLTELDAMGPYPPGTLMVMPVSNTLVQESLLDETMGSMLRDRNIKPLLLFPQADPSLSSVGSFLQWSGARFLYRNDTSGPVNYASAVAKADVSAFLGNTFQNDHPIVRVDTVTLAQGESSTMLVLYQLYVVKHRLAVITSSGPITDVGVDYMKYGEFRNCLDTDVCTVDGDSILYWFPETSSIPSPGEEWALQVTNNGSSEGDIAITWSEVTVVGKGEELDVQVWSSEGRGPVADIPENQAVSLYVSVMTYETQVLNTRIVVSGILEVTTPDTEVIVLDDVVFTDDGQGADLRQDDSIYSFMFSPDEGSSIVPGTTVTVKELHIEDIDTASSSREKQRSEVAGTNTQHLKKSSRAVGANKNFQSSRLFTRDPTQEECCGSFVEDPNIDLNHRIAAFNVLLRDVFEPIEITRTIVYVAPTTTSSTAEPTTRTSTTTPTEAPTGSTTPSVAPTAPPTTTPPTTTPPTTTPPTTTPPTTTTDGAAMSLVATTTLTLVSLTISLVQIFA